VNSRTDAVEALSVHLRERVRFVRAGLLKITDRRGFNHVAHQEALDGLVLRNEAARGFAEDALNVSSRPGGLVAAVRTALLRHLRALADPKEKRASGGHRHLYSLLHHRHWDGPPDS